MAVYVDQIREYGGSKMFRWTHSCHMYADRIEELHAMAFAIGMKREWFQDKPDLPHYDLVPDRRARALKAGAIEHTMRQMVEFMQENRRRLQSAKSEEASS